MRPTIPGGHPEVRIPDDCHLNVGEIEPVRYDVPAASVLIAGAADVFVVVVLTVVDLVVVFFLTALAAGVVVFLVVVALLSAWWEIRKERQPCVQRGGACDGRRQSDVDQAGLTLRGGERLGLAERHRL